MRVTLAYPSAGNRTGGVVVNYEFANGLARRGHEVHFLHGPAWPTRIDSLDQLPDLCFGHGVEHHIFDSFDDDLPETDVTLSPNLPERFGLPCAVVQGFRMLSEEWERDTFRLAMPKLCVATWLIDVGLTFGSPPEQLLHVPVGLDHDVFRVRTPLEERTIDVAMLHHTHREKGSRVGLEALAELVRRRPISAVVFGREDPPPLPDGVVYRQALEHDELADEVYNCTRVFLQSSFYEGFGLTPIEAMGSGAALVTTDCGGSRDYAIDGETARVVEPGDSVGLADAIEGLLADDDERIRLAGAGERFVRRFDWEHTAELLDGHLEAYLADPARFTAPPGEIAEADWLR